MAVQPLQNIRIINFAWYWAGPLAGQVLGDMGADLITIESRTRLTTVRLGPPYLHNKTGDMDHILWAHNLYRSARAITLNLSHPKARDLFKQIAAVSDVVLVNFGTGVMDRLGLGYEDLRLVNPALVMVSLSSAGVTGPLKNIQFFGGNLTAVAGIELLQGYEDEVSRSTGAGIPDPLNGLMGAFATLVALQERQRTGKGRFVDISQWEAITTLVGVPLLDYWFNKRLGAPTGNRDPMMAPHGVYRCKGEDRFVAIAVANDEEWERLRQALGSPDWADDERFTDLQGRLANQKEIDRHIEEWTMGRSNKEVTELLQKHRVAAFPALSVRELYDDPHFEQRGTWAQVEHTHGRETVYGTPWKLSDTPGQPRANHLMGSDNRELLCDVLGIPSETVDALEKEGVLT